MAYVDKVAVKQYLGISTTTDDDLIEALIARAQRAIESYCHRWFEARTETRYYRRDAVDAGDTLRHSISEIPGLVNGVLYLDDDLLSVTTLTNGDGTVIPTTGYWLGPRNSGPPYWYICLKSTYSWAFDTDGEISVAGTWGYSATAPEDIVHSTIRLAAYYYRQKDVQVFDTTAAPELGVITVPQGLPADVKILLEPYRRVV